jgi:hypothetical protein
VIPSWTPLDRPGGLAFGDVLSQLNSAQHQGGSDAAESIALRASIGSAHGRQEVLILRVARQRVPSSQIVQDDSGGLLADTKQ